MDTLAKSDLKPIFETLPGLYLVLDTDFVIKAVSNAYLHATITKRESILGRGLFEVFPDNPDDSDADGVFNLRASLNYVLKYGQPHKMAVQKYDIRRTDGSFEERYWSPLNTPVFNEQNQITSIIHSVVDVTLSQKTAKKLKNSKKDYQLLVSSVKDYAIFMVDLNGCVASWNSGAESIKGYTAAEIIGKPINVFYTAEDLKLGAPQSNLLMAVQHDRFETEGWRLKKDGSLFWASIVITALKDENGRLYGYSKITRDITERKKAQDQVASLSRLINQSNDAIYTVDAGFKIQSWNHGAQKLYGFTEEEVLGKVSNTILRTALDPEEINSVVKEIAEKDYWSGELKRKTKADQDIYVHSSSTTIRDNTGVIVGYTVVSFNITEQRKLREQVNHLADIVEQSSDAIVSRGLDQRIITWNRGAEILFGHSKKEAIGKTSKELGITKLTDHEIADIGQQIIEKGYWKAEMQGFHKNGSSFLGAVTVNTVKNEQGEVTSTVFIVRDISLRKQLEVQLKKDNDELEEKVKARTEHIIKTERRFKALTDSSHDVITMLDESLNVFYRSPSTTRITGWTNEEMINNEALKNIHPDDIEMAKQITKEVLANPGKPVNCIARNQHKDGHYLWLEGVVINLLHDENVKAIVFNFRDVTERIIAEEKLITNEKRFRALIENNNEVILLLEESLKVVYRSPSASRITGWAHEEIIGMDGSKNIHPDDIDIAKGVLKDLLANPGKPINCIFRSRHKDGRYLWLEGIAVNLLHDENVKAIVFNFRDVTERINAEEKVKANEKRFRALIENNNDIISLLDESFKVIYRSPSASRITGWADEEMINVDGIKNIHPDDIDKAKGIVKDLMTNPGKPINCLFRNRHKDGRYLWLEGIVINLLDDHYVKAIVFNFRDVTERIIAEEKLTANEKLFRALIENNHEVITLMDESFKLKYRSPAAARVTGWTNEDMLTLDATRNIHPDDKPYSADIVKEVFANPGKKIETKFRMLHKAGHYIWIEGTLTNLLHNEFVKAVVFNYRDVTERISAEEKLIASEKQFRALIENNNDLIILTDAQFRIIYRSPSAARITGWTNQEMKKIVLTKKVHPNDRKKVAHIYEECMANPGKHVNVSYRINNKRGECLHMEGIMTNLLHEEHVNAIVLNLREVTERIEVEEKLAASEIRFRSLIENSTEGIVLTDEFANVIYRSPGAQKITGVLPEKNTISRTHPEDLERIKHTHKEIIKNPGFAVPFEGRFLNSVNNYIWLEGTFTNLLEVKGVNAIVSNFRNITQRKEAEEKLRASEKQYRTTLDNMLERIQIHDFNWQYIYVNDALVGYSKYSREELLGRTLMDKYPGIEHTGLFKTLQRCMDERVTEQLETEFIFPDGTKADFELSIQPVPEGLFILSINITERKKAEKALKEEQNKFTKIVATSPGLIFSFRMRSDGFVSFPFASSAFEEIFGVQYETVANDVSVIINSSYQHDKELLISSIAASAGNMSPWQLQFRYNHPKKGIVWLEGHSIPTAETDGSILWHGVITDVTERKVAEDKINEQNLRLKSLSDNLPGMMFYQLTGDTFENRKFSYVSSGVTALTGKTQEEILNDPAALYSQIASEDVKRMKAAEMESYNTMSPFNIEIRCRDFKGNSRWLNIISTPRRLNNDEIVWDGLHLDITEKKMAEQQKEFDSNNLKALINNTNDLIWSVDSDYNLITSNEAFDSVIKKMTGKTILKGSNTLLKAFNPALLKRYKTYYKRALKGETFSEIEHDDTTGDFWSEISFYPMYKGDTVIGTACFSRNITEKKKAEEEIRKANERFELVVKATNDVIWDWDFNSNSFWRNKNYYAHFGYDEKTTPANATSAWNDGIHPDDKKRVLAGVDECIKSKRHFWTDEYRYLKADKTIAYILDCGYILYTEKRKAYRMVGAMLDITARKQAEQELKKSFDEKQVLAERLSIILNTLPANIALLDGNGYIIDVNDAWRNFADANDFTGSNYCIGLNYVDIANSTFGQEEGDGKKVARGIKAVLKNKLKEFVYEYPCDSLQIKRWFRMIVTPLQGAEKAGAVVMHIDISEVRRMEQERLKAKIDEQKKITKAMLMGQEKERNHLGQELHDNINQILAGTKLYLSIAGNKNEELKELIKFPMELIDTSIEEMRILCHKMVSPLKNISLEQLIRDITKKLDESTTIKTRVIYTLPKGILSDELKLNIYRIIQELVNNIVKYAGAENAEIIIQSDEMMIDITVTDDGAGFDIDKKRNGIGISNMINRVGSFNGEIKIESAKGKGCKTSISIPYK
jgi:PAS domain S-box-containing protein